MLNQEDITQFGCGILIGLGAGLGLLLVSRTISTLVGMGEDGIATAVSAAAKTKKGVSDASPRDQREKPPTSTFHAQGILGSGRSGVDRKPVDGFST